MASLMEDLISTLVSEQQVYQKLVDLSDEKRDAIIYRKLEQLEGITAIEQGIGDELKALETKVKRILKDMAVVTGHDGEAITVSWMIDNMPNRPQDRQALIEARDSLIKTANEMQQLNQQNQALLTQALEMVEFDLQLFRSVRQAPETANYNKNALGTGDLLGSSGFDAKQ